LPASRQPIELPVIVERKDLVMPFITFGQRRGASALRLGLTGLAIAGILVGCARQAPVVQPGRMLAGPGLGQAFTTDSGTRVIVLGAEIAPATVPEGEQLQPATDEDGELRAIDELRLLVACDAATEDGRADCSGFTLLADGVLLDSATFGVLAPAVGGTTIENLTLHSVPDGAVLVLRHEGAPAFSTTLAPATVD
jgi:hypothetical protein